MLFRSAKMLELGNYGGFILSYNGCQIINAQNGEILFERRINPEMLPYLEKKARKNGFALFTYHDDTIITDSPENEHIQNEARLNNLQIIKEEGFEIQHSGLDEDTGEKDYVMTWQHK